MTPDLSYTTGRAREYSEHLNKWDEKKKISEVKCNTAAVIIRYPSKLLRSTRS